MKKLFLGIITLLAFGSVLVTNLARAEDTEVNKAKDAAGDAMTNAKKTARSANRKVRQATGNDNALKDAQDKANDASDTLSNEADKVQRKATEGQ